MITADYQVLFIKELDSNRPEFFFMSALLASGSAEERLRGLAKFKEIKAALPPHIKLNKTDICNSALVTGLVISSEMIHAYICLAFMETGH